MRIENKLKLERKRRWHIRKRIRGTADRPRMSVRFSQKNIHVQFIDDQAGSTLAYASSVAKATPDRDAISSNVDGAKRMGALAASAAQEKGIKRVVFDRSGARYHGKVKALADAAREGGLEF
jgi:large subunit ribosomal protein L18